MIYNTMTDKEKGLICMKKELTTVLVICTLIGAVLGVFILKDGMVSVPEAAEIFIYLLMTRVAVILGRSRSKEVPKEEETPSPSLNLLSDGRTAPETPTQKPAA